MEKLDHMSFKSILRITTILIFLLGCSENDEPALDIGSNVEGDYIGTLMVDNEEFQGEELSVRRISNNEVKVISQSGRLTEFSVFVIQNAGVVTTNVNLSDVIIAVNLNEVPVTIGITNSKLDESFNGLRN